MMWGKGKRKVRADREATERDKEWNLGYIARYRDKYGDDWYQARLYEIEHGLELESTD